jgi:Uri superfamily endonuclease
LTTPQVPIIVLGDNSQGGSYLLRIRIVQPVQVIFGRYSQGKPVAISEGACLYVGSALNGLGPRLIRHATRSGHKAPHSIRQHMLVYFPTINLGTGNRVTGSHKKLHWHVDHLLDQEQVELTQIVAIRSSLSLETSLARFLEQETHTSIIGKGLGATDAPGDTHLLKVQASETWWSRLPARLMDHLKSGNSSGKPRISPGLV